ncbi:MAG: phosphoribosylaminoimidazolesuccinocarboxamide synthase [Bdellovibrio sp.]|nr:MAG: phosphoribosylaminoimidazolesuccinocarboxamide synthase [Bdellovibrio sp.]
MKYQKGDFLYEGKAKKIYSVKGHPQWVWMEFKDDLTAFNAKKRGAFEGKGRLNLLIANKVFEFLKQEGVKVHWVEALLDETAAICQKVDIIPLEVVVRNWLAGSTAKRLGFKEGTVLEEPLVELYYKKDELDDPFINEDQALLLGAATREEIGELKKQALKVNQLLLSFFQKACLQLVDFKLEFGRSSASLMLADEITPDSCRLWDIKTKERLDKDRFRRDWGRVKESYAEIWSRLESI